MYICSYYTIHYDSYPLDIFHNFISWVFLLGLSEVPADDWYCPPCAMNMGREQESKRHNNLTSKKRLPQESFSTSTIRKKKCLQDNKNENNENSNNMHNNGFNTDSYVLYKKSELNDNKLIVSKQERGFVRDGMDDTVEEETVLCSACSKCFSDFESMQASFSIIIYYFFVFYILNDFRSIY